MGNASENNIGDDIITNNLTVNRGITPIYKTIITINI